MVKHVAHVEGARKGREQIVKGVQMFDAGHDRIGQIVMCGVAFDTPIRKHVGRYSRA
jgi:hypothetical protein